MFFTMFRHILFSGRSGPGPLGPVRKILVVRSGPEGPQFARSVGTLLGGEMCTIEVETGGLFLLVGAGLIGLKES